MNSTLPPPLPVLDAESFRRTLAGLQDPNAMARHTPDHFREAASQFVYVLAICFNRDELDAITLWERIGSAIGSSCAKVDDGDLDRLISLAMEHVKADYTRVAASPEATAIIGELTEREESWRLGFVHYIKSHSYTAIIHGKRHWLMHKDAKQEARNANAA